MIAPPQAKSPTTTYAERVVAGEFVVGTLVRLACERHLRDLDEGKLRGLWFDDEAARFAIGFFRWLRHSKGEWAGQPFVLEPWQEFVVGSLFGWKRSDGTRRFRRAYLSVARKNGKALALDTPIPTPSGWTTMGALREGDTVFDEAGMPCTVTFATDVMYGHDCYEVEFSDGERIVADAEHIWWTNARRSGLSKNRRKQPSDHLRTTEQVAATLTVDNPFNRKHGRVEWNHSVPVAEALFCSPTDLPIDPYLLGAWLGDGHSAAAMITTVDQEVLTAIEATGTPVRHMRVIDYGLGDGDRSQAARNRSVQARLRALGLLGNKHIPSIYQRASIAQRIALLRGLMDTDGYVSKAGQCEFVTISERLAADVRELLCGLGFKPTMTVDRARIEGRDCGPRYRIQFWAYDDRPVFSLMRKRVRQKPAPKSTTRAGTRQIVGCRKVESVPVRCIQVDSPSHLYLAGRSMIPTHNTQLAAGIGLLLAFFDGEPGAEVYAAATKRDQAKICWSEAQRMVQKTPQLAARIRSFVNNLHVVETASKFEPLSSDYNSLDGLNPHGAIIDEYHAHPNGNLADVLESGTGARRQPLMLYTTTAGIDNESACRDLDMDVQRVLEGIADDDALFGYIARIDADDRWDDPSAWPKANPNLGVSVKLESLEEHCARAQRMPREQNEFRRKRCNQWTEQAERWLDLGGWDRCGDSIEDLSETLVGRPCFAGLDLSTTKDLTAFVAAFPDGDGGFDVLARFWIPVDNVTEAEQRDRVPYQHWIDEGYITATEGNVTDYDTVGEDIAAFSLRYEVQEIPYDPWNATQLALQLQKIGATVVPFRQGYQAMSEPSKFLESLVLSGKLRHGGNPVLRWMAANVAVMHGPNESIRPVKEKSSGRIDGIVALIMALGRAMVHQVDAGASLQFWAFEDDDAAE